MIMLILVLCMRKMSFLLWFIIRLHEMSAMKKVCFRSRWVILFSVSCIKIKQLCRVSRCIAVPEHNKLKNSVYRHIAKSSFWSWPRGRIFFAPVPPDPKQLALNCIGSCQSWTQDLGFTSRSFGQMELRARWSPWGGSSLEPLPTAGLTGWKAQLGAGSESIARWG